jgi:hypothetical protein
MKNAAFWDVAPCRSCVNRRFGGTYRHHLQGRKKFASEEPALAGGCRLTGNEFTRCSSGLKEVCKLLTWVDKSARGGVQEHSRVKLSSDHTGSCHQLRNWNNPHATIPDSFHTGPSHPRKYLHIPHNWLIKIRK